MSEVESYLCFWSPKKPASEVGIKVARLLEEWDGLHHFEESLMRKVEWSNPHYIDMKIRGTRFSTFDFNQLTRLVFLAHDHCIRVEISPCNGTHLKLVFHLRKTREGWISERHPTLETAVIEWRKLHPINDWLPAVRAALDGVKSAEGKPKSSGDLSARDRPHDFPPILPLQGEGAMFT